ncbi:MAG: NAD(P)/FAD-dependent oxidoreductase [Verrucomicrobiales bacterium]
MSDPSSYDVTILGGGLAGLTCALHCLKESPDAKIAILEKRRHPVPEATHKVGESSVEVGATYFRKFLDLEDHLENEQIPKMGLRLFLGSGDNSTIEDRLEVGGTDFPPTPSYQFDRGRFENYLGERCRSMGVEFIESASVKNVALGKGRKPHLISFEREGAESTLASRWVVDASGRAAILKRKLGLKKESSHRANSAWIRIGTRIKVDDWCDDAGWQEGFTEDHPRWQSTNHLLGEGYWIWIIPLSSGSTSIGIVADEKLHDLGDFNSQEKMLSWLEAHEPQLAGAIREHEPAIQDFCAIKRYSMECRQLFSGNRWGIVGDAGNFIDPFYSPGNDFIALGNFLVCELIKRDLKGKSNLVRVPLYNRVFKLFYGGTELIFKDNYPLFGNHQVMPVKILWDWMVYWTIPGHIVIQERVADPMTYVRHLSSLKRLNDLNRWMQAHFRRWHEAVPSWETRGTIDTSKVCLVMESNRALLDELDARGFGDRFVKNVAQMETLFWEIADHSGIAMEGPIKRRDHPGAVKNGFRDVLEISGRRPGQGAAEISSPSSGENPEVPAVQA